MATENKVLLPKSRKSRRAQVWDRSPAKSSAGGCARAPDLGGPCEDRLTDVGPWPSWLSHHGGSIRTSAMGILHISVPTPGDNPCLLRESYSRVTGCKATVPGVGALVLSRGHIWMIPPPTGKRCPGGTIGGFAGVGWRARKGG